MPGTRRTARLRELWRSLDRRQRRTVEMMAATVALLHIAGFATLLLFVTPGSYRLASGGAFTVGVGITAYTLGLRHAFDADHIAAIDNTTRKLMSEGKRPLSVGFWFSLGHSTIVFGLALLLSLGVRSLAGPVRDSHSQLHRLTGTIGTLVSGGFLYAIAALNLVVLLGIIGVCREMRRGCYDERALEAHLEQRGLMARLLRPLTRTVGKPEQMYRVGLLFGLGFDTATEVALLLLAGGAAGAGLPWYAILCLPVLFAAGMSALDTIDGSFMNFAYGWALSRPVRKVFYNLAVTSLSVAIALVIGTIELGGLLSERLSLSGSFWRWLQSIDINALGFIIAGLFALTWGLALTIWRLGRFEERWTARLAEEVPPGGAAAP